MRQLKFAQFRSPGCVCYYARPRLRQTGPIDTHWHDFVEVFWIDAGRGTHWINGRAVAAEPGMLVFVAAEDRHTFGAEPGQALELVNVAFLQRSFAELRQRYPREMPNLFGPKRDQDRTYHVTAAQRAQLREAAEELRRGRLGHAALDRFLLNLAWIVTGRSHESASSSMPVWLTRALQEIQEPANFRGGIWAFFDLCGRSPEHVTCTCRRFLDKTTADVVNGARLDYAAAQLAQTQRRVLDIALDCSLDLSHMHRLFHQRFGVSPGVYRRRQQHIIAAPRSRTGGGGGGHQERT